MVLQMSVLSAAIVIGKLLSCILQVDSLPKKSACCLLTFTLAARISALARREVLRCGGWGMEELRPSHKIFVFYSCSSCLAGLSLTSIN